MKKLSEMQRSYLFLIDEIGGSFLPSEYADPGALDMLTSLIRAKCLTVEVTDGGNRYHITELGKQEGVGSGPDKIREVFGWL